MAEAGPCFVGASGLLFLSFPHMCRMTFRRTNSVLYRASGAEFSRDRRTDPKTNSRPPKAAWRWFADPFLGRAEPKSQKTSPEGLLTPGK